MQKPNSHKPEEHLVTSWLSSNFLVNQIISDNTHYEYWILGI